MKDQGRESLTAILGFNDAVALGGRSRRRAPDARSRRIALRSSQSLRNVDDSTQ